jgi:hypothetical protein
MKNALAIAALALAVVSGGLGQAGVKSSAEPGEDITGIYSFVHEGEFVQIEANDGHITGVVSRFKNEDVEKPAFVDQFFEEAKLEGSIFSFRTKPAADGVWFEFSGRVEHGAAKAPGSEGYWSVKGTLTEHHDANGVAGKVADKVHELTLKSFPEDAEQTGQTEGQPDK